MSILLSKRNILPEEVIFRQITVKHLVKISHKAYASFSSILRKRIKTCMCALCRIGNVIFFCSKSNNSDFWTVTFSLHFLKKAKKKSEDCCWMMNYNYFDESFRNFHASAFINSISIFLLESINFCSSSVISTADDMYYDCSRNCRQFCYFF